MRITRLASTIALLFLLAICTWNLSSCGLCCLMGCLGPEAFLEEVELSVPSDLGSEGLVFWSNGDGTCYVGGIGDCTDEDIVIPSISPDGDKVTGINDGAFCDCNSITSITIPYSVESIGESAFYNCDGLTSVTLGNGITRIRYGLFYDCDGLTSITIPDSVRIIDDSAFFSCDSLTSVTIGDSVTSIGCSVFSDCTNLTSIMIPDSVTEIGWKAFEYCDSLATVNYTGSKRDWAKISIDSDNEALENATINYNYVP